MLSLKGGDFLIYVYCNKEKRRVRRLITSQISQEDNYVRSFVGAS